MSPVCVGNAYNFYFGGEGGKVVCVDKKGEFPEIVFELEELPKFVLFFYIIFFYFIYIIDFLLIIIIFFVQLFLFLTISNKKQNKTKITNIFLTEVSLKSPLTVI